jgi:polyisoprenoid-binding protein YceI
MATWSIDTGHSAVRFGVRHMMFTKTRGRFTRWDGELRLDPANLPSSSVEVTIDAASIDTGDPQRDGHLRSADFLDAETFPTLTFRSTKVEDLGEGKLRVSGELTIRGVTRPVVLDTEYAGRVKDPWGNDRAGFAARTAIDRTDFGLRWNQALETGGLLVGNKVEIELELEAVAAAAKAA